MKALFLSFALCVFILSLLSSCTNSNSKEKATGKSTSAAKSKGVKKNGIITSHHANGKVRAEINYKDGKKDGIAKEYYSTGSPYMEIEYKNGIKDGLAKRYYENGKLYQQTPYVNGKIQGKQLKYYEDGKPMAIIPYHQDEPCSGLVEYTLKGEVKKQYPTIVITPLNTLLKDNKYTLRLTLSDKSKNVQFYTGSLSKEGCVGYETKKIWESETPGVTDLEYVLPRGHFIMDKINIIAKVKTVQGNYYFIQKPYNLAVENR